MPARTFTSNVTAAGTNCPAAVLSWIGQVLGLRHAADVWLLLASAGFLALVLVLPNPFTIGIGIWWILNTVSHNFIHQPFFKSRAANRLFAIYLSMLTLIPHCLWRDKHLAHHAGRPCSFRHSGEMSLQFALIALLWGAAYFESPRFVINSAAPGFLLAMALCWLHGYFEHATGTTSHYSKFYNRLFFNDGFHLEHHDHPALHWSALPRIRRDFQSSKWPAVLRWCDWLNLNGMESLVTRWPILQRWVTATHERAIRKLTAKIRAPETVVIIGGGLFPRTALVVHSIWPAAAITIIDSNPRHLEICRRWLRGDETLRCERVSGDSLPEADLIFVPLAFDQDKDPIYTSKQSRCIILHDWLWNAGTCDVVESAITSVFLVKRLNLIAR